MLNKYHFIKTGKPIINTNETIDIKDNSTLKNTFTQQELQDLQEFIYLSNRSNNEHTNNR